MFSKKREDNIQKQKNMFDTIATKITLFIFASPQKIVSNEASDEFGSSISE